MLEQLTLLGFIYSQALDLHEHHHRCLTVLVEKSLSKVVIETSFNRYLENEGPIDDEPLNEYVYNMQLFMITLLCNKYFLNLKMMLLSYFGLHWVTSSLPVLVSL